MIARTRAVVSAHFRGGRDDVGHARRRPPLSGAVNGSAPRSTDSRDRWSSSRSVSRASTRVGGGDVVGTRVQHHRHQVEEHTVEQPVQLARRTTVGSPTRSTSALTPSVSATSTAPLASRPRTLGGKGFGHPPSGLDVAQRVTAAHVGPLPGQRRLGQRVDARVQRADRETVVGRRIQQPLRLGGQIRGVAPGALGQHPGYRRAPPARYRNPTRSQWVSARPSG